jgi:carboxymethylenebutenolidase
MNPNNAIQKAMNRRSFIAGAASGVAGALAMGSALPLQAQQAAAAAQQGPPPLPPAASVPAGRVFYSAIEGETLKMRGYKGDSIDAYMARPTAPGKYPGVVVVHHMPGWDEATIEITRKFAQHGYNAICPNLHFRGGKATSEGNAAAMREAGGLTDASAMGDLEGAIKHLRAMHDLNGKVGIIGYCSGGRQVYLAACTLKGIDAAVACYPGGVAAGSAALTPATPVDPLDLSKDMSCPIMTISGRDDQRPSPAHIARIDAELTRLNKVHEVHIYDNAGHSIFATDQASYRPVAAMDGWKNIFRWYEKYLG